MMHEKGLDSANETWGVHGEAFQENMVEGGKRALRAAKTKTQEVLDNLLAEYNEMVGYVPPVEIEQAKPETEAKAEKENEDN